MSLLPSTSAADPTQAGEAGAAWSLERVTSAGSAGFDRLVTFVLGNPLYRWEVQHRAPQRKDAVALLTDQPAGARASQKYVWLLQHQGQAVACLEVLRGWPQAHTVYIGFLMVDEHARHQGHARAALRLLAERCRTWSGIRRWRLAVVPTQADALRFWQAAGFRSTGERTSQPGYVAPLMVLERALPVAP